jgi:hypothetical protein
VLHYVVPSRHRWLVFVHQLPAHPSNGRVKIWRRLQQVGASPVKNAVHVLPNTPQSKEDFEWLRTEVIGLGGEATVFEASSIKGLDGRQIHERVRQAEFRVSVKQRKDRNAMRRANTSAKEESARPLDVRDYQHRCWVTRPRPGVDRFSSAWLIRRFIDRSAQFAFATSPDKVRDSIPFDMYQSEGFRHEGDRCTFEVLQRRFNIEDARVARIAEIVHDLDLKDDRFQSPDAPTIGKLVEGLRASIPDDGRLLEQGIALFEALYLSFESGKTARAVKSRIC